MDTQNITDLEGIKILPRDTLMPEGTYVITDPCYVPKFDEHWLTLLDKTRYFNSYESDEDMKNQTNHNEREECYGVFEVDGTLIGVSCTNYGDGSYYCSAGFECWVDAGLIGIIPIEFFEDGKLPNGGCGKVEMPKPFGVDFRRNNYYDEEEDESVEEGIITFGHISITT